MASYYSKPADYGKYTQPVNLELINFVLSSKQQKYDYNLAKLDDKITNQIGTIDLARAGDKEYFLNKASETLNSMGDMSKLDLSKNGVTRQVDSRINSIVDDRVLNDIISTKNYRTFQSTLQAKQAAGDDTYSVKNAAYAMEVGGVNAWLNGADNKGNQVDSLGQVNYEDHVDVGEEFKEIVKMLPDLAHVIKRFDMNGSYFVTQEGERLQDFEVRAIAEQLLPDTATRQMEIDGWYNYDRGAADLTGLSSSYAKFTDSQMKGVASNLADFQLKVDNEKGIASDKLTKYQEALTTYTQYSNDLKAENAKMIADPEKYRHQMSSKMEKETVLNNFGSTFAIDNVGDPIYAANSVVTAEKKLQWDREKFMLKAQETASKLVGGIQSVQYQQTVEGRGGIEAIEGSVNDKKTAAFAKVNAVFTQTLKPDVQANIDATYDENSGRTLEEHRYLKMQELSKTNSNVVKASDMLAVERGMLSWGREAEALGNARTASLIELEDESTSVMLEEYKGLDNIRMSITDENGNTVDSGDYLEGIETSEDFNKPGNIKKKKQMLMSYYADKILSKGLRTSALGNFNDWRLKLAETAEGKGINALGQGGVRNKEAIAKLKGKIKGSSAEDTLFFNRIVELTGSEDKANAYLKQVESGGGYDTNEVVDSLLQGVLGPVVSGVFNWDNSVVDDNKMNRLITLDNVNTRTTKSLNETYKTDMAIGTVVDSTTAIGKQLTNIAQAKYANVHGESAVFKKGNSISITADTPDTMVVSGMVTIKGVDYRKEITLLKANLPQALVNQVDFNTQKPMYDRDNMEEASVKSIPFFKTSNNSRRLDIKKVLMQSNPSMSGYDADQAATLTTRAETVGRMYRDYPKLVGTQTEPTQLGLAIDHMVKNSRFNLNIKNYDGYFYEEYTITTPQGEVNISNSSDPIKEADYQSSMILAKYAPQIPLGAFLNKQLNNMYLNPGVENETMTDILEIYGKQ